VDQGRPGINGISAPCVALPASGCCGGAAYLNGALRKSPWRSRLSLGFLACRPQISAHLLSLSRVLGETGGNRCCGGIKLSQGPAVRPVPSESACVRHPVGASKPLSAPFRGHLRNPAAVDDGSAGSRNLCHIPLRCRSSRPPDEVAR
jgi:hypothetical protein